MELRDFINANEANISVHSSRKIVSQLTYGLYSEADKQAVATELAKEFLSPGIRHKHKSDTSDGTSNTIENRPRRLTESPKKLHKMLSCNSRIPSMGSAATGRNVGRNTLIATINCHVTMV